MQKSHISVSSVHKYRKSCSFSSFDRFTCLLLAVWGKKLKNLISPVCSEHKYHKSCSQLNLTILRLITNSMKLKLEKSHISVRFIAQVTQIVSLNSFARFTAYYTLYDLRFQKSNIFVSSVDKYHEIVFSVPFDRFSAYYNCMRKNFKDLISVRELKAQVSQIVLLSSFYHF